MNQQKKGGLYRVDILTLGLHWNPLQLLQIRADCRCVLCEGVKYKPLSKDTFFLECLALPDGSSTALWSFPLSLYEKLWSPIR